MKRGVSCFFNVALDYRSSMASQFTHTHTVAFHETDMAGLVHFSNFFRWMENAEHAFIASIGGSAVKQDDAVFWGWPRGKASCDYRAPVKFGDVVECQLFVKEIKIRSVVYFFRFFKDDPNGERIQVAKGQMTCVYARFEVKDQKMEALELDADFVNRIQEATPLDLKWPKVDL